MPACAGEPLTEMEEIIREYEYQEAVIRFRMAVQLCRREGGFLLLVNPSKRYRDGIEKDDRPHRMDMRRAQCVKRDMF